jgi:hypothetical protein
MPNPSKFTEQRLELIRNDIRCRSRAAAQDKTSCKATRSGRSLAISWAIAAARSAVFVAKML